MVKVLFVPQNSREIDQFAMIKPELDRLGAETAYIAINAGIKSLLERAGLPSRQVQDYKTVNMLDIIDEEKPDLVLTNPIGSFPVLDAFAVASNYRNLPCLEVYNGMVISSKAALRKVPSGKPLQVFIRRTAHAMTNVTNIRAVICLLITLKATSSLFRFLEILPRETMRLAFPIGRSFRYREGACMAVHSQPAKDSFVSLGWPPERVFVIGQPRIDTIFRRDFDGDKFLSTLGIPENRKMALLTTQPLLAFWSRKNHREFITAIVNAMDSFPDHELVIKLHPEEKIEDYQNILRDIGREDIRVYKENDIYDLINACNLLMTTHSTTALEAMILNKPVLCIDFTGRCPTETYTGDGAAIGVHKPADLIPAVDKALYDTKFRQGLEQARKVFLEKHIYKPDGQTSKRVAELIIRLSEEKGSLTGEEQ